MIRYQIQNRIIAHLFATTKEECVYGVVISIFVECQWHNVLICESNTIQSNSLELQAIQKDVIIVGHVCDRRLALQLQIHQIETVGQRLHDFVSNLAEGKVDSLQGIGRVEDQSIGQVVPWSNCLLCQRWNVTFEATRQNECGERLRFDLLESGRTQSQQVVLQSSSACKVQFTMCFHILEDILQYIFCNRPLIAFQGQVS